ncbi:MAG: hypothetical protein M3P39_01015, partial [Actinomycetota bacterium]|nr:hypothetical protein [Actinomycetota bacterium]
LGLVWLAGHALARFPVRDAGRELVHELRDQTGETTYLAVVHRSEVIYIDQASSPHVRVMIDWVGRRTPLTVGITGAVLLAHQPPEVVAALLDEARRQGRAGAEPGLVAELERTRRQGYLARFDDPTSHEAVVCVPVFDHLGVVVAALCLGAVRHRVDERRFAEELIPLTLQAAARISARLGYNGAPRPAPG